MKRLSLRSKIFAVGLSTTVLALLIVFFVAGTLGSSKNANGQMLKNSATARLLASHVGSPPLQSNLAPFRNLLVAEDQHVVVRTVHETFSFGASFSMNQPLVRVAVTIDGGEIIVTSPREAGLDPPIDFVLITLGALLAVLASVLLANAALGRETRRRVDEAIAAAKRVSMGDFTARVGSEGPETVARLGQAFDAMARRLDSIDREQREFLADLAHEIATPIQALSGFSMAIIDGTITKDAARPAIESQTARLTELLDELTQLRSIDSPQAMRLEDVDLFELCRELEDEFAPIAHEAGVRFTSFSEHVTLVTDQKLVETVLRNFLTNAFRYTPSGERITIYCRVARQRAIIGVSDSGPGISPDEHQRIFERFYRTEEARDRISGGTGLGLTIARSAARTLGGHIEIDSALGRGSDFRLVLPLTAVANFDVGAASDSSVGEGS
ncbi:MAG TPA: HAMP domain-containing sensor histidine kinase [Acidimicrobiales bacterium]|nr:HAMP domain-containing sensor histidine kinase [Acidimicrobiales bacterium]